MHDFCYIKVICHPTSMEKKVERRDVNNRDYNVFYMDMMDDQNNENQKDKDRHR